MLWHRREHLCPQTPTRVTNIYSAALIYLRLISGS